MPQVLPTAPILEFNAPSFNRTCSLVRTIQPKDGSLSDIRPGRCEGTPVGTELELLLVHLRDYACSCLLTFARTSSSSLLGSGSLSLKPPSPSLPDGLLHCDVRASAPTALPCRGGHNRDVVRPMSLPSATLTFQLRRIINPDYPYAPVREGIIPSHKLPSFNPAVLPLSRVVKTATYK